MSHTISYTFLPLSPQKPIFAVQEDPTLFAKGGLTKGEIELHRAAASLGVAPALHAMLPDRQSPGAPRYVAVMQRICGVSVADFYGDQPVPQHVWTQIYAILQTLWNNGIEYIDITPYNFMLETETGKVWVIDFGHARRVRMNWFLQDVLNGTRRNEWTPDFA